MNLYAFFIKINKINTFCAYKFIILFVLTNSLLKLLDDYDTIKNIKKYLYVLENYQII